MANAMFDNLVQSQALKEVLKCFDPSSYFYTKMQVSALLTSHQLAMRVIADNYPTFMSPLALSMFFNVMSDETKRRLVLHDAGMLAPIEAFQNPSVRRPIIKLFRGESLIDSPVPSINSGTLFGMMLSAYLKPFLEMFPQNGIPLVKISALSVNRIAEILAKFIITISIEPSQAVPEEIYGQFHQLGAGIAGTVKGVIDSSPFR
jgi:hypothetical protein